MHTFARAISRHRCHRGGSQEPEEQPCQQAQPKLPGKPQCSAPTRALLLCVAAMEHSPSRLHAPFQSSSSLTPALQTHNTQQE